MRLEYRVLRMMNKSVIDFDDPTLLKFDAALATQQTVAHNTPDKKKII